MEVALPLPEAAGVLDEDVPEAGQYTIDELAAESEVPSRTIRFYQSKGVLPAPEKQGRVAYYRAEHVERLKLIAKLQDRGLRIDAIRALLSRVDRGEVDVGEWLGLEAQLTASWANDQPRTMTEKELGELAGKPRAGLLADLLRLRVVQRQGDVYLVRSPGLLSIALRLEQNGVDLEAALAGEAILRKHLGRVAKELAALFFAQAERGHVEPPPDGDWPRLLEELRPTGIEAVRIVFGQEMERVLRDAIENGKLAKLPARRRRRGR
ncbi:MAG: MerR family transcriptional regulator [Myxococcales bacterium]|nr:MerR family transcriptional regulator [Myxococcales bacterium]